MKLNGTSIVKLVKANKFYHSHCVEGGTHKTWLAKGGAQFIAKHLESLGYIIKLHKDSFDEETGFAEHPESKHSISINYNYYRQMNDEPYGSVFVHKTNRSKYLKLFGLDDEG